MAHTQEAQRTIQRARMKREWERLENVSRAITLVTVGLEITHVELSLALGSYAPARGAKGASAVNAWARATERPTDVHVIALEFLVRGIHRLFWSRRDGRRQLFNISVLPCPNDGCEGYLRLFGLVERCTHCEHEQQSVKDHNILVLDQEARANMDEAWGRICASMANVSELRAGTLVKYDEKRMDVWLPGRVKAAVLNIETQLLSAAPDYLGAVRPKKLQVHSNPDRLAIAGAGAQKRRYGKVVDRRRTGQNYQDSPRED